MVKVVMCVRKRDDISQQEFHDYWLNKHSLAVKSCAAPLKIRRYVQSHTTSREFGELVATQRGMAAPFDGVAELWWDDVEELQTVYATPAGHAASLTLHEDEERFLDLSKSTLFFTEEHVIFE